MLNWINGGYMVKVYFKDKLSDTTWTKEVTKAFLAKMYFEFKVIG